LRVGEGRGFVVELLTDVPHFPLPRVVITAAQCLPSLPPCGTFRAVEEKTFQVLGPLLGRTSVWAECLFADPIMDIAVLGSPDNDVRAAAYEELLAGAEYLSVADAPLNGNLRMLSLEGEWFERTVDFRMPQWVTLDCAEGDVVAAMSGGYSAPSVSGSFGHDRCPILIGASGVGKSSVGSQPFSHDADRGRARFRTTPRQVCRPHFYRPSISGDRSGVRLWFPVTCCLIHATVSTMHNGCS
jgi:hypothetical protein